MNRVAANYLTILFLALVSLGLTGVAETQEVAAVPGAEIALVVDGIGYTTAEVEALPDDQKLTYLWDRYAAEEGVFYAFTSKELLHRYIDEFHTERRSLAAEAAPRSPSEGVTELSGKSDGLIVDDGGGGGGGGGGTPDYDCGRYLTYAEFYEHHEYEGDLLLVEADGTSWNLRYSWWNDIISSIVAGGSWTVVWRGIFDGEELWIEGGCRVVTLHDHPSNPEWSGWGDHITSLQVRP